ncbi:hypothetical protein, partial [Mycobacterium alsense]|uniref:hypothetical protein n=1 Tax=Mycobacterium alsense TaxID=324058 RepID=UPI000AA6AE18
PPFSAEPHGWGISMSVSGEFQRARSSVLGDTATGSVSAASNPSEYTVGEPVTIKLVTGIGDPFTGPPASVSGDNGVALQVSIGTRGANYCNETTHNYCGG